MNTTSFKITLAALFTALIVAGNAVAAIPFIQGVPITLANGFSVLAGMLLGPLWGSASVLAYIALGCLGLPVFSQFTAGWGAFATPTGFFIIGYLVAAFVAGLISDRRDWGVARSTAAAFAGQIAVYLVGLPWFVIQIGIRGAVKADPAFTPSAQTIIASLGGLGATALAWWPFLLKDAIFAGAIVAIVVGLKPLWKIYLGSRAA